MLDEPGETVCVRPKEYGVRALSREGAVQQQILAKVATRTLLRNWALALERVRVTKQRHQFWPEIGRCKRPVPPEDVSKADRAVMGALHHSRVSRRRDSYKVIVSGFELVQQFDKRRVRFHHNSRR